MEASTWYCAYLAFTPAEYKSITRPQELKPSVFSYRSKDKYFKLFPYKEVAFHQCLKSRTRKSANSALKLTTWWILTLHPTDKQWLDLLMAIKETYIRWGPKNQAYRVHGVLNISKLTRYWEEIELDMIGIDAWADHALEKCVLYPEGQCAECKVKNVKVYKSMNQCTKDWYCSKCWHKYILQQWEAAEQQDG